jgi:hypothetical protein
MTNSIPTIVASVPCLTPPTWALLERRLIATMSASVKPFLERYTKADGTLIWGGTATQHGRDDLDDFYEAVYNWSLLYLLGGDQELLSLAYRQWEAITTQLTTLGLLVREFERGADFFHQGEGLIAFYFLCLADPTNPKLRERAQRFASFYKIWSLRTMMLHFRSSAHHTLAVSVRAGVTAMVTPCRIGRMGCVSMVYHLMTSAKSRALMTYKTLNCGGNWAEQ